MRTALTACLLAALAAGAASGQQVISAKSGTIHYTEGAVLLDGAAINQKPGQFPQMRRDSVLSTEEGRAEVLLGPGVFLRVGENSEVALLSDSILDTRLALHRGSALIEIAESNGDELAVAVAGAQVILAKPGLYRFDAEPGRVMVYDGEAMVARNDRTENVKASRMLLLDGAATIAKFDKKQGDALFRWAGRRSEQIAKANFSAAMYANRSSNWSPGWTYNPFFGMFTFLPGSGMWHNFWGYTYWSPSTIYIAINPTYNSGSSGTPPWGWNAAGGYRTVGATSAGTSGVIASSAARTPSTSSSSGSSTVSSAPIARPSGSAGTRGK